MKELQQLFGDRSIPDSLKALHLFGKGREYEYCKNFNVIPEDSMSEWMSEYCYPEGNRFGERLIEFAQGGESLASYALWIPEGVNDTETMPIVFIESGAGVNLIASSLKDFLVVLSYDEECGGDYFYKDCEEYEESEYHQEYRKWLKNTMGLEPVSPCQEEHDGGYKTIKEMMQKAKEEFGDEFSRWLYAIEHDSEEALGKTIDTSEIHAQKQVTTEFESLIDLLYCPIIEPKLLGVLDGFGIKRPIADGNYLKEKSIELLNADSSLCFKCVKDDDTVTLHDIPVINVIWMDCDADLLFPFGICKEDNYEAVVNKLNKDAEYEHCISEEIKIWILKNSMGLAYEFKIRFKDEDLEAIKAIIITDETPSNRSENSHRIMKNRD